MTKLERITIGNIDNLVEHNKVEIKGNADFRVDKKISKWGKPESLILRIYLPPQKSESIFR